MKRIKKFFIWLLGATTLVIVVSYFTIEWLGGKYVHHALDKIPQQKVGLVLGTSKYLSSGYENRYFTYRIQAAYELYHAGKIQFIIVSGDNGTKAYNEPREMIKALVAKGVPENRIQPDYAGFRTFDSVVRCKEVFGQEAFTIISQPFHNERAVFIARAKGIKAHGYNAKDITGPNGFKVQAREVLARVKVFIDLITLEEPKFLGDKIHLPV